MKPYCRKYFVFNFSLENNLPYLARRLYKDWKNFFELKKLHFLIADKIDSRNYNVCIVHPDKLTQAPFILRYLKRTPSVYYCEELLRIAYEKELRFRKKVNLFKKVYENITRIYRKNIDKSNARSATLILTSSEYNKKKIKKFYKKSAIVLYPGVNTRVFYKVSRKKRQVLFVGGKEKMDGYELIKKAVKLAKAKEKFNFEVITFSKGREDKEISLKYSESILTLCASYNEPFGLIPLESMACKTPVIAVNQGGYKETIVDNKTGYLLKRDSKQFADKILYLIKNPKKVEYMGNNGRKLVIRKFSWEKHCSLLERKLLDISRK